jgi:multiple antibiotic resistance protein
MHADMNANTLTITGVVAIAVFVASLTLGNFHTVELAGIPEIDRGTPWIDKTLFWGMLASLFAIMNPLVAVPFFAAITEGQSKGDRNRLAMNATLAVSVTLFLAALLGREILEFFAISIGSFRIAGGIIVMLMGLSLLRSDAASAASKSGESSGSQAVCPIAIPLLAGPGAIASIIVQYDSASSTVDYLTIAAVLLAMIAIVYVTLRVAVPVARFLGSTGLTVATRLFGMIVIAIAIDMATIGAGLLFPHLSG